MALLLRSERTHGFLAAAIHGADLVFHEAGHPLFGLLGWRFLTILGGTLLQLAPPLVAAVAFWRRRQPASLAVVVVWLGVNLVNVGQYAADAQARALPLLGADASGHDWWNMLRALGLLEQCHAIGGAIGGLGWALQVACAGVGRRPLAPLAAAGMSPVAGPGRRGSGSASAARAPGAGLDHLRPGGEVAQPAAARRRPAARSARPASRTSGPG